MQTTLAAIRSYNPCVAGWRKLLKHLHKSEADNEPVRIATIIVSNGLDDALWCLRAVSGHDREIRLYAVWCARQAQSQMADECSLAALDVAERFSNGLATVEELAAARDAALDAARDAALDAARDAAWAAAGNAARDAAWAAARDAAWAAARTAAWAAAWAAQSIELLRVCACIERGEDPYPVIKE